MVGWILRAACLIVAVAGVGFAVRADAGEPSRTARPQEHAATASTTAVPWLYEVAASPTAAGPATPVPAPAGTLPCRASALDGAFIGEQGITGAQQVSIFVFGNHTATTCTLSGHPQLRLVTAAGRVLAASAAVASAPERVTLLAHHGLLHAPAPMQIREPGQATLVVLSGGEVGACRWSPQPVRLRVLLPAHGGALTVQDPAGMRTCNDTLAALSFESQDYMSVGDIVVAAPPSPPPPRYDVRLVVPAFARAGQAVRYSVLLANRGAVPLAFPARCPSYAELLDPNPKGPGGPALYVLNCHGVAPVVPGGHVTFAMELPASEAVGDAGRHLLYWQLVWFPAAGVAGTARATLQLH